MTLNESFNIFIQVLLEIFYDFGHQVSRLLWTTCYKMLFMSRWNTFTANEATESADNDPRPWIAFTYMLNSTEQYGISGVQYCNKHVILYRLCLLYTSDAADE